MFYYILSFAVSFLISFLSIPVLIKIAIKFNILDYPSTEIKTHNRPVPYLGGIAVSFAFFISLLLIRYFTNFPSGTLRNLRGIMIGGMIITILGFVDDLIVLNYKTKFFWQIIAGIALIYFGVRIEFMKPVYLGYLFSIIWIVGITNSINILDVMDGLSSGVAIIASIFFLLINLPAESIYVNFSSIALIGALLGFWIYNKPDAKIYLGDTGALFTGFILASNSLGAKYSNINDIALYGPVLILGIPIYETLLVMWSRYSQNKLIFLGSKDHFSLRLLNKGWSKYKILKYTYFTGFILGFSAFLISKLNIYISIFIYVIILSGAIFVAKKLIE